MNLIYHYFVNLLKEQRAILYEILNKTMNRVNLPESSKALEENKLVNSVFGLKSPRRKLIAYLAPKPRKKLLIAP